MLNALAVGIVLAASPAPAAAPAAAQPPAAPAAPAPAPKPTAQATLKDSSGKVIATARFTQGPRGVLLALDVVDAPPGPHAFHVHEKGVCDAKEGFKSAGGHFNPTQKKHGFLASEGRHCGDMPNVEIPASGKVQTEFFLEDLTLNPGVATSLFDADGSALVLHVKGDDYRSDPTGEAGGRMACGVVEAVKTP
jgi:Cu-Zn family superoxide dismutase